MDEILTNYKLKMKHDVHIAEFNALRSEIDSRAQNSGNLLMGVIAAAGTAIIVINFLPEVLLAIASVISFGWVRWLDHHLQIFKIATYIAIDLSERVLEGFYWEGYVRDLESGDVDKVKTTLNLDTLTRKAAKVIKTRSIRRHVAILFGLLPILLVVFYGLIAILPYYTGYDEFETQITKIQNVANENPNLQFQLTLDSPQSEFSIGARWGAIIVVVSAMVYSWFVHFEVREAVKILNNAIEKAASNRPSTSVLEMDNNCRPPPSTK